MDICIGAKAKSVNLLVSAAPGKFGGENWAVIIIEDISEILELQGLLAICSSCKKVKDEKGCWKRLESYIEEHSEADFTHGFCPDCTQKLYPSLYEKIKDDLN